jgi:hypothetical protein
MRVWFHLCLVLAVGCGQTGQDYVDYPIVGRGTGPITFESGDWHVELDQALVAFGPVYFCATSGASSDLCPTAMAELRGSGAVDVAVPSVQALGTVRGTTGAIHSATYDFGISWFATMPEAAATTHAAGGHSAHFEGTASNGTVSYGFVADVDVIPQTQGARAVQGAHAEADIQSADALVEVAFDAAAWWRPVRFDDLATATDDPVDVSQFPKAINALVIGMTASAPPTFEWRAP